MTRRARGVTLENVRVVASLLVLLLATPVLAHDPDARLAQLDASLAARPDDLAKRLERARLLRTSGEPARAFLDADHAVRLARASAEALGERGLCLEQAGHHARAISDLGAAIAVRPRDHQLREARARSLQALGRNEEALADLEVSLAVRPEPDLFLLRASLLRATRGLESAVASLKDAVARGSGAVVLEEELRRREAELDPSAALARADAAIRARPDDPELRLWRGRLHESQRRPSLAKADFEASLSLADRRCALRATAMCRLDRARALEALGRLADALAEARSIVVDASDWSEAREFLTRLERVEKR